MKKLLLLPTIFLVACSTQKPELSLNDVILNLNLNEEDCPSELNIDPPSTIFHLISETLGVEIDVPYNPDWGNSEFRIKPYEESQDKVSFGLQRLYGMGCNIGYAYTMKLNPPRQIEEVLQELQIQASGSVDTPFNIVEKEINGFEAVEYQTMSMTDLFTLEIFGEEHTYSFYGVGGNENLEALNQVVETLIFRDEPISSEAS